MDKSYVVERIDDWEHRLNALYAQIEAWFNTLPPDPVREILAGSVLQRDEPLMRQFEVPPRLLPTRAILYGKNRLSFVPSALWVIGANGRVNITTNTQQFALVDLGGAMDLPSDWQIVTSKLKNVHRTFDQEVLNNLVLHQAIEAA